MKKINSIITFVTSFFVLSCATYSPQFKSEENKTNLSQKKLDKTFYLLGGSSDGTPATLGLQAFGKFISSESTKKDHILFLGNTFSDLAKTDTDQNQVSQVLKDFKGDITVIPGQYDWSKGSKGLDTQSDQLKKIFQDDDFIMPLEGCPIESLEIEKDIQLIIIDTQWYLENWDDRPGINDDCEIKTRKKFIAEIEGELKKNKDKTIVFAMHHPILTNGAHGGKFGAVNQLVPLPVVGSLVTQVRSKGAISIQDRYNERYDELMSRMQVLTREHDRLVFVSGHEESLQYIQEGITKQIISGSIGSQKRAGLGKNGHFSYGGQGFAALDIFKDGSTAVRFYKADQDGIARLIFSEEIIKKTPEIILRDIPTSYPKTVKASVYKDSEIEKTGFYKTVWGDHYRNVYGTNVTAPVALLDTLYGGLEVVRAGGGHQTRSLRLVDKDGKDYNMRALKKSAVQFIQTVILKDKEVEDDFRNTISEDLILDFYTAAHPYGAFTVPKLSEAAGVFHTNPKLFWVPKQKSLGKFNDDYGDALYMIVERPDEPYDGAIFNFADDIESTDDLLDKIRSDEENVVDEKAYIRARMFDMLLGDWDRHTDQWRWAEFKNQDGKDVFVPIPRDRDQVYANFDGGILDVVRALFSTARQFQIYDAELKHTKWFNAAGIKLDRALLENFGREEWITQAKHIQNQVTDEIIDAAFKDMPSEAQDETAMDIKRRLKGRRDNLVTIAEDYYEYFSKLQVVTGTDKDDYFEITRLPEGKTNIKTFRIKDGDKADLMVDRTYDSADTNELWVYGLDDDDVFEVKGKGDKPVFIRIIGGQNNDTYKIANGKKIKVYDHKSKKNTVEEKGGAAFRFTDNYNFNTYDSQKQILSSNLFLPAIGFNPDDGFKIGASDVYTIQGFQGNSFKQQHRFAAGYYVATESFDASYEGEFANVFGNWNFLVGANFRNPSYAKNFFGFGNETLNPDYENDEFERDYNQVRLGGYGGHIGILNDTPYGSVFKLTASYEGVEVQQTPNRFITLFPYDDFGETKSFVSATGEYVYESYDNKANPTRGMHFDVEIGATQNIEDSDGVFGFVNPQWTLYNALLSNRKLVLKTTALGQVRIGNNFEFYQAAQIGGDNGLRGYRDERFTGRNAAVGSADLRYSFKRFKTGIAPIQVGVFGGADVGRVWVSNDDSDELHSDYGGGFWVNAADVLSGTFNLFTGDEGLRFTFGIAVSM